MKNVGVDLRDIGQMVIAPFPGNSWNSSIEELLSDLKLGGVIHFAENIPEDADLLIELNRKIVEVSLLSGLDTPFITVDEEGARVSRLTDLIGIFPSQKELAEIGADGVRSNYEDLGRKVAELGFNLTWAPVLDVHTNPDNPVIGDRSFSENHVVVADFGRIAIRALAGEGLLTSGKHFPGHGNTSVDSHLSLPVEETTLETLRIRELYPFRMALEEGVDFFMTAHILYKNIDPKYPATFSKKFLTEILRENLGFEGLIVTDDLGMGAVSNGYSIEERIELSVNAGADLLLVRAGHDGVLEFLETFRKLVESGKISSERISQSVERIRRVKKKIAVV